MNKIKKFLFKNDIKALWLAKTLGCTPEALAYKIKAETFTKDDWKLIKKELSALATRLARFSDNLWQNTRDR